MIRERAINLPMTTYIAWLREQLNLAHAMLDVAEKKDAAAAAFLDALADWLDTVSDEQFQTAAIECRSIARELRDTHAR
jgi:hypothetical protein